MLALCTKVEPEFPLLSGRMRPSCLCHCRLRLLPSSVARVLRQDSLSNSFSFCPSLPMFDLLAFFCRADLDELFPSTVTREAEQVLGSLEEWLDREDLKSIALVDATSSTTRCGLCREQVAAVCGFGLNQVVLQLVDCFDRVSVQLQLIGEEVGATRIAVDLAVTWWLRTTPGTAATAMATVSLSITAARLAINRIFARISRPATLALLMAAHFPACYGDPQAVLRFTARRPWPAIMAPATSEDPVLRATEGTAALDVPSSSQILSSSPSPSPSPSPSTHACVLLYEHVLVHVFVCTLRFFSWFNIRAQVFLQLVDCLGRVSIQLQLAFVCLLDVRGEKPRRRTAYAALPFLILDVNQRCFPLKNAPAAPLPTVAVRATRWIGITLCLAPNLVSSFTSPQGSRP